MPSELCSLCLAIPFRELHDGEDVAGSSWSLGTLSDLRLRPQCGFCQLVADTTVDERVVPYYRYNRGADSIAVTWYDGSKCFRLSSTAIGTTIRFVTGTKAAGRHVSGGQIDPAQVKKWLEMCQSAHAEECPSSPPDPHEVSLEGFRLVDVDRQCVVDASIRSTYVTLSYVWGHIDTFRLTRANKENVMRTDGLCAFSDRLPLTIRDAMLFVRKMGLQYLWIDSLCLVQDDAEDLKSGVEAMDTIYEQSLFTIIAAGGPDASHGLRGVRSNSRKIRQSTCEVSPGIRIVAVHEMEALLKPTVYNRRAWTFQEYFLARRRLVFVNDMVFLQCRRTSFAEDVIDSLFNQDIETLMYAIQSEVADSFDVLSNVLFYYSPRDMTYESDALRALAGICRRVGKVASCRFLEGFPVASFDLYLGFWPQASQLIRRHGFPSWSWAGWKGHLGYPPLSGDKDEWLAANTWIVWYKRSPAGWVSLVWDPVVSDELRRESRGRGDVSYRGGRSFQSAAGLENVRTTRVMPSWDLDPRTATRSYHVLQFWTMSVYFLLQRSGQGTERRYDLLDNRAEYCGYLELDSTPMTAVEGTTVELILLSASSKDLHDWFYPGKDRIEENGGLYTAMFVEWAEGVAERRGLAQIYCNSVVHSLSPGPVWKEIVLG